MKLLYREAKIQWLEQGGDLLSFTKHSGGRQKVQGGKWLCLTHYLGTQYLLSVTPLLSRVLSSSVW